MNRTKNAHPTLEQALRILRAQLPALRERYRVKTLGVFGSYVRGEQKKRSDLDILVEFDDNDNPLSLLEFIALKNHLSDLLKVEIDLVEKSTLKPVIGSYILEEVVPV